MKRITCNHKNKVIYLYPDYASGGMWCECGLSFGDPTSIFPEIPSGLISLIDMWSGYWEMCSSENHFYYREHNLLDYHQNEINKVGRELEKILMKYHPCKFVEENAKIISPPNVLDYHKQIFPEEF